MKVKYVIICGMCAVAVIFAFLSQRSKCSELVQLSHHLGLVEATRLASVNVSRSLIRTLRVEDGLSDETKILLEEDLCFHLFSLVNAHFELEANSKVNIESEFHRILVDGRDYLMDRSGEQRNVNGASMALHALSEYFESAEASGVQEKQTERDRPSFDDF